MCIRAFITVVAWTVHIKMSAFNCFKLWIRCVLIILFKIVILFLEIIYLKFILVLIISAFKLIIIITSCFSHIILKISSKISSSSSKVSSVIVKRLLRIILILIFLGKVQYILMDRIIWFSKFFISVSKVTFHTEDARLMSIEVSASFCFIFLVNFRFGENICALVLIEWFWSKRHCICLELIWMNNVRGIHWLTLHHNLLLNWKSILGHHLNAILIS